MSLNAALVDQARVWTQESAGVKVEGSTVFGPASSQWFRARLMLAASGRTIDPVTGVRVVVKTPTLLVGVKDADGEPFAITVENRVEVVSPELAPDGELFDVIGAPEPLRKKRRVIGYQVPLQRRVVTEAEQL